MSTFRRFAHLGLGILLLGFLVLRGQEPAPSDTTFRPTSSKGVVQVKNGSVDAVHGTLDLAFPLSPALPGRIPGSIMWTLSGWKGGLGDWARTANFQPVLWPRVPGEGKMDLTPVDLPSVTLRLFGASTTFSILSAPYGPNTFSLAQIRPWLEKRGVVFPPNAVQFLVYASTDGTAFYVEGMVATAPQYLAHGMFRAESSIVFRAAMVGEKGAWWTRDEPDTTYVGTIWGDKVSVKETLSGSSPFYSVRIEDLSQSSTDWIQMEVQATGTPEVQLTPMTPTALDLIFFPSFLSHAQVPFLRAKAKSRIVVSNGMGIAPTVMDGTYDAEADFFEGQGILNDANNYYDRDFYLTGIVNHRFFPTSLTVEGALTSFNLNGDIFGYPQTPTTNLTITHPSGLVESFDSVYNLERKLWNSDSYMNEIQTARSPGAPRLGEAPWQNNEVAGNQDGVNTLGGIVQITTQEKPGFGTTTIITQVVPRLSYSGTQFTPFELNKLTVDQPRHVTTILTYPTLGVSTGTPFRGVRLVHPSAAANLFYDPYSRDTYLFFASVILQEQVIRGTGAPYATSGLTLPVRSVLVQGKNWEPTNYSVDEARTFDGWRLDTWINPQGVPRATVNPVSSGALSVVGTGGVPSIPIRLTVSSDWDERGPRRTDVITTKPNAQSPPPLYDSYVPYSWGVPTQGMAGTLQQTTQIRRHFDTTLGLLLEDGSKESLSGSDLPSLRTGVGTSMTLSDTTLDRSDPMGRVRSRSVAKGQTVQLEDLTYIDGNPTPSLVRNFVTAPGITTPTFSGASGVARTFGWGTHLWVLSETDRLTGRETRFDRNLMGQVTSALDVASGILTTTNYDTLGRISRVIRHGREEVGDLVTEYQYDPSSLWKDETLVVGANRVTTRTFFDARGRVVGVNKADGSHQTIQYNSWGEKIAQTGLIRAGESEYWYTYQYDDKGRLYAEFNPDTEFIRSYPSEPHFAILNVEGKAFSGTQYVSVDDQGYQHMEVRDLLGQRSAMVDEAGHLVLQSQPQNLEPQTNVLKKNPALLERWLKGITTFDGRDGLAAVTAFIKRPG